MISKQDVLPPKKARILIIGAGATGTGLARDLALRGLPSTVVDRHTLNSGASGANHGLLHSGARYVHSDAESAAHCYEENQVLRRVAPRCIEQTGGLYVAVEGDDENYVADFPDMCKRCGIPTRPLHVAEARAIEPELSNKAIAVYAVPDATVDPFTLSIDNMNHACSMGAQLLTNSRVVGFHKKNSRITSATIVDSRTGSSHSIEVDEVINAAGAWSGNVAALAGVPLAIVYSKGTLIVSQRRLASMVINRLRKPSNADIVVPGGIVSVLGTTSLRVDGPDSVSPTTSEVDTIIDETSAMLPALASSRFLRAFSGVRPLVSDKNDAGDDRAVSRDISVFDHVRDGVENFVTVTGGKLTTYRQMAEKAADVVCYHLGVFAKCVTRTEPLPSSSAWSLPGEPPRAWSRASNTADQILCECELVPQSAVDTVVERIRNQGGHPDLSEIVSRSRVAKGACQGSFCGYRVLAHLAENGHLAGSDGLEQLRSMLQERWKGQRVVAFHDQLRQIELLEAVYRAGLGA